MEEGTDSWDITLCKLYVSYMLLNLGGTNHIVIMTILYIYCNNFFHMATTFLEERVSVSNLCQDWWASGGVREEEMQDQIISSLVVIS